MAETKLTAHFKIVNSRTGAVKKEGKKVMKKGMTTEAIMYHIANEYDVNSSSHYIEVRKEFTNSPEVN